MTSKTAQTTTTTEVTQVQDTTAAAEHAVTPEIPVRSDASVRADIPVVVLNETSTPHAPDMPHAPESLELKPLPKAPLAVRVAHGIRAGMTTGVVKSMQGIQWLQQQRQLLFPAPAPSEKTERVERVVTPGIDWWLFTVTVVILGIGLIMVLSSSGVVAEKLNGDKYYFFKRQILFAFSGGLVLCVATMLPRETLYKLQYPALFLSLVLLSLTLTPIAPRINGAQRWLPIGPFSLQPMEFVKIALVLYLAYFMSTKQDHIKTFTRGVIPPFVVTGLFCLLLLMQPDFGSAVILTALLFFMCVAGGTRFLYLFVSLALAIAGAVALAVYSPYRMRRLTAFLDPFKDAQDTGYQLVQSFYALGSGGFFGMGVGASKQKMFYLPEAHNDFIMAVLGEEMGFVGMTLVMALFAVMFWRCYKIVLGQPNLRDRFSAFGLSLILAMGACMNLAVIMGLAPPKGVPMPLLSYGGSSLLATMLCVGLLLNFSRSAQYTMVELKPIRKRAPREAKQSREARDTRDTKEPQTQETIHTSAGAVPPAAVGVKG